jgi:hypothetical protein
MRAWPQIIAAAKARVGPAKVACCGERSPLLKRDLEPEFEMLFASSKTPRSGARAILSIAYPALTRRIYGVGLREHISANK